jgi:hypothetical protein
MEQLAVNLFAKVLYTIHRLTYFPFRFFETYSVQQLIILSISHLFDSAADELNTNLQSVLIIHHLYMPLAEL